MNWALAHWTYSSLVLSNSTDYVKLDEDSLLLQKFLLSKNKRRLTETKDYRILYYRVITTDIYESFPKDKTLET